MNGIHKIPFFGVDRQYANLREEILSVTDAVYRSGWVLDGENTLDFEQAIERLTERKYAITVNSGTQALVFALRSIKDNRNKVLIPAVSFVATLNAVLEAGFDPVFCDVDPWTGLIDFNKIPVPVDELAAVMYVNLYGNVIDYNKLLSYKALWDEYGIPVIEDAAQSFGAYYRGVPSGKLGDISVLSFDPTKNLNNYGSGGMVLTDDPEIFEAVNDYKDNGKGNMHSVPGTNSKMSEADCAQMLVKLKYFDQWQTRRKEIANHYTQELSGVAGIRIPPVDADVEHSWHKYAIHVENRLKFQTRMTVVNVDTKVHYSKPLHLEPVSFIYAVENNLGVMYNAEEFCKSTISLPIYPEMSDAEVEYVVDSVIGSIS